MVPLNSIALLEIEDEISKKIDNSIAFLSSCACRISIGFKLQSLDSIFFNLLSLDETSTTIWFKYLSEVMNSFTEVSLGKCFFRLLNL